MENICLSGEYYDLMCSWIELCEFVLENNMEKDRVKTTEEALTL